MRHVIDTEFLDRGPTFPVELISLGIASEDGKTFYAVNENFDWREASPWLVKNVKPHLPHPLSVERVLFTRKEIMEKLNKYFERDPQPQFWGYYADWDWLLFCHLWGGMLNTPKKFPHLCLDIEQYRIQVGMPKLMYPHQTTTEHNALNDALWSKDCLDVVDLYAKRTLDGVQFPRV